MINGQLVNIYKRLVPVKFRDRVTMMRNEGGLNTIRKNILSLYREQRKDDREIAEVMDYLKAKPLRVFPYYFPDNYNPADIAVYNDPVVDLNYVLHQQKRMYFKRSWSVATIKEKYNDLLIEQDSHSPHCYLDQEFTVEPGDIVADIGAAEGIFALSVIEKVKQIYLFETDPEWIEALQASFLQWEYKVKIVHRFVSDKDDSINCSLDKFCIEQNVVFNLIKVDVDGAELSLINGAKFILASTNKIKLAICTYHKSGDEALFREIFLRYSMKVSASPGYMVFLYDPQLSAPYLRRGLLRVVK